MSDFIKNTIYTSIGVVSITNDKLKELVEDLIQNNHYTKDEGKRLTDDFLFNLREQLDAVNVNIQSKVDEIFEKFGLPSIYALKNNIEDFVNDVRDNPTILLKLPSKK